MSTTYVTRDDNRASARERGTATQHEAPVASRSVVQYICADKHERRRHQRVFIPLLGRFMRENRDEYPCQIVNVSAGGMLVKANVRVGPRERIVLYVDVLGRIEGHVVRNFEDGFALELTGSAYKREKIVDQLTWLANKERLSTIEDRRHERLAPRKSVAKLTLFDGTSLACQVLNVSLGGAAVAVEPRPAVGEMVSLGIISGQVVRHIDNAVSIQFAEIQNPATIERQFG